MTTLAACLLLAGCASVATPGDDIYASVRRCGLDGQIRLDRTGPNRLQVRYLNPNADQANVDCFTAEMDRLGMQVAFAG